MATDWARHGLQVNAIAPGLLQDRAERRAGRRPRLHRLAREAHARRAAGARSHELVGAAIFLASDASSFVNGHILYVDGGITASL